MPSTVTCPKCNRTFRDNYNLQRHLQKDIDCATTTNQTTPIICVHLLNTLLMVLQGPLRIPSEYANDDAYIRKTVGDVWRAVVSITNIEPNRAFELLTRLFELLNLKQLEMLYGSVMVDEEPPNAAMLTSLRAVYQYLVKMRNKGVQVLYRRRMDNMLLAMERLPGLVVGVVCA